MSRYLGLLICASCASSAQSSISLYEAGDFAGAAKAADSGLAQHPADDDLWGMRIRAALALGDGDGVATAYAAYAGHRDDLDKPLLRDVSTATLRQALASPSAKLKIAAIEAIERIEIEDLSLDVAKKMEDADDRVAAAAAVAIIHGGYEQAAQVAGDSLRSPDAEARRIAVDGIGKKVGLLAKADVEKAGRDADARVRAAALHWLGAMKDRDAVELLAQRLHDTDGGVRAAAARALAELGIGDLAAFGTTAVDDRELAVRLAGVRLLAAAAAQGSPDRELVALAGDPDPIIACEAAIAVRASHGELAAPAVARGLAARDATTRAAIANVLVRALGKDGALAPAHQLAADPDVGVRIAAARVLAHDGDPAAATAVFTAALAADDADDSATAAATDLAALGDAKGSARLSELVRDPARSPERRAAAADAHLTAQRVTPGLVAALADRNPIVRVHAAATLGLLVKH